MGSVVRSPQEKAFGSSTRSPSQQASQGAARAVIDSVESTQRALDELIAREGPSASLLHLFNSAEDECMVMSDPEPDEDQEGSSGIPIAVA